MKMLEANRITKVYGGKKGMNSKTALSNVSLTVHKGEFVGVMGPSGSGKTTLLNVLSGIDHPTSGSVKIDNHSIESLAKDDLGVFRRQNIGFVFQDFNLLDSLTMKENIMLPMILEKVSEQKTEREVTKLLNLFQIDDIAEKYPYHVSGGQQQRAAVARAIINHPKIIFADEPTGNLDSKSAKQVMESFVTINEEREGTILFVTHDPTAASYCNRVIFIKDGGIHSEIRRKNGRKEFFNHILDVLAILGGERYDI